MKKVHLTSPLERLLTNRALKDKLRDATSPPTMPKKRMGLRFPAKPRLR